MSLTCFGGRVKGTTNNLKEIDDLLEEMRLEHEREEAEAAIRYEDHTDTSADTGFDFKLPEDEELPF